MGAWNGCLKKFPIPIGGSWVGGWESVSWTILEIAGIILVMKNIRSSSSRGISTVHLDRIRLCSLFSIYSQAFQVGTGYELKLVGTIEDRERGVPVMIGRNVAFYLVSEDGCFEEEPRLKGLLRAFAIQLGDEANRAILESGVAEPQCLEKAKKYIAQHGTEKIYLNEVAEAVGVCSFQICRLFKRHLGMTMTEYVSRHRVERARRKLENPDIPIAMISREVGFTSSSQFNRNFRQYAGVTPTQYRADLNKLEHCQVMQA